MFKAPTANRVYNVNLLRYSPLIVSAYQAKKSVIDGAITYFLFTVEKVEESKGVQEIPMIEEFP